MSQTRKGNAAPVVPVRPARVRKPGAPRDMCRCRVCGKPYSVRKDKIVYAGTAEHVYVKSGMCRACFTGKTPLPKVLATNPVADAICPDCLEPVPIGQYMTNGGRCASCEAKRKEHEAKLKAEQASKEAVA